MHKDILFLSNFKPFGELLKQIQNMREDAIGSLLEAKTEHIQQISGQIIAFDSILQLTEAKDVIKKTELLP
jgi:hypothetical protein